MYRSLVLITLAFMGGIAGNYYLQLPLGSLLLALAVLFALLVLRPWRTERSVTVTILLLALVSGALRHSFATTARTDAAVHWLGWEELTLTGNIREISPRTGGGMHLVVRTRSIRAGGNESEASGLVRVTVYEDSEEETVCVGDLVAVTGALLEPMPPLNPGEFDYPGYLHRRGIWVCLAVDRPEEIILVARPAVSLGRSIAALRNRFIGIAEATLPAEYAALLTGILYGYRAEVTDYVTETLTLAGVVHVLAVSGLHVGFIVTLAVAAGRILGLGGRLAAIWNLAAIYFYILLTGAKAPVVRAGLMAGLGIAGDLANRERDGYTNLATAALVLLAHNPQNLFDVSFQLSFTAVWGLIHLTPALELRWLPRTLRRVAAVSLAAQIAVSPLLLYYFGQLTPVALLANLLVIPLTGVAVVLGFIAGIFGLIQVSLAAALNTLTRGVLWLMLQTSAFFASLPYGQLYFARPPVPVIGLVYLLLLGFPAWQQMAEAVRQRPDRLRLRLLRATVYGLLALLVFNQWLLPRLTPARMEVTFLAVGQGDAAFIQTGPAAGVLIDGGNRVDRPDFSSDLGAQVVSPFLRQRGIRQLAIVLSHHHADHIGGLLTILEDFPVSAVYGPPAVTLDGYAAELAASLQAKSIRYSELYAGDELTLAGGAKLMVLAPDPGGLPADAADGNERSLVIKLVYGRQAVLFTGDMESGAADRLLAAGVDLKADVLKVSHHGSIDAWNEAFYRATAPHWAVIPVGKNFYGHPSGRVIESLQSLGVRVMPTKETGAVTFRLGRGPVEVEVFRSDR